MRISIREFQSMDSYHAIESTTKLEMTIEKPGWVVGIMGKK
jgi:hypothetical protein